MDCIYLDHTATTPLDASVLEAMMPYLTTMFGNASSVHSYGREARAALERARGTIAHALGADQAEVFFTSGGTESDNLAIRGIVAASRHRGRTHIITSKAEHHAVLDPCESLEREGTALTVLPVDASATVSASQVTGALRPATALVSIMHANNEVGTISPVRDMAQAAHASGAVVHSDAVQTVGKIPLSVRDLEVDLLTCTALKLYGPKGVGVLYVRKGVDLEPLFAEARAVYDSVEEMRVQALGAYAMKGVSNNLSAALAESCERRGLSRVRDRTAASLPDAVSLMVRERLTGLAPPANAKALVDAWRTDIERDAGGALDKLAASPTISTRLQCRCAR